MGECWDWLGGFCKSSHPPLLSSHTSRNGVRRETRETVGANKLVRENWGEGRRTWRAVPYGNPLRFRTSCAINAHG